MHIRHFLFLAVLSIISFALPAKELGMEISYAEFMDEDNQTYLEVYFAVNGQSLDLRQTENGRLTGGVQVSLALQRDSNIVAADKFRLAPEVEDTNDINQIFIHQVRFPVEKGAYNLSIDIQDINEEEEKYHLDQAITTTLGGNQLAASEPLFLNSFEKSTDKSVFSKSGYDLIPLVSSGSAYFDGSVDQISFYMEIYNSTHALGEDEPYVIKYYIKDADRDRILENYAAFSKKTASKVEPVLASLSIASLKTGNYDLTLDVLNKEGDVILSESKFFYRRNDRQPIAAVDDVPEDELVNSFVNDLGGLDSVYLFIKYLNPISTEADLKRQEMLLAERDLDQMKQYFYAFWNHHHPENPAAAWKRYHAKVKIVNKQYATRLRPGYMSDRGRVFLVYGKPDMVDVRRHEPNNPPYEIWQYGQINTPYAVQQINKMFVFAEFSPSTNDYQLFHSTAVGELSSRRWRYDMAMRHQGYSDHIDSDREGNEWGSRTNNNIILDGSGADRQNR